MTILSIRPGRSDCGSGTRSRPSPPAAARRIRRARIVRGGSAVLLALIAWMLASPARPTPANGAVPLEHSAAPSRCDEAPHHQLDFWVGDWQVFDAASHQLVAFDRVRKLAAGCILLEHLSFLTDMYRRPGVPLRLAGISLSRYDGERWVQMWADNQWGAILLRGALDAQGRMVFVSVIPSRGRDVKLVYARGRNDSVRMLQYVAPEGSGKWVKYGDLLYRPNR
jgi:hypothetical protein